jgi:hypothetical protein
MRPLRLCAAILLFPSCSLCCGFLSNVLTHAHKEYDILTTPFRNPLWNRCVQTKCAAFDPWDRGHLPRLLSAYFGYFAVNPSPLGCNLPGCVRDSRNLPPLPAKSRPVKPCNLCPPVANKPSRLRAFAVKFRPVNKDRLTQARRSWNRSRIRAKDTMPEKAVGRATATGCSRVHARTAGME